MSDSRRRSVDPWEKLANAIIEQAVDDYKLLAKNVNYRLDMEKKYPEIRDIVNFFLGKRGMYAVLTSVEGERVLEYLREWTWKKRYFFLKKMLVEMPKKIEREKATREALPDRLSELFIRFHYKEISDKKFIKSANGITNAFIRTAQTIPLYTEELLSYQRQFPEMETEKDKHFPKHGEPVQIGETDETSMAICAEVVICEKHLKSENVHTLLGMAASKARHKKEDVPVNLTMADGTQLTIMCHADGTQTTEGKE